MSPRTKYSILVISSIVVTYAVVGGMMGRVSAQGSYPELSTLMEVYNRIQGDYVDDPALEAAWEGAVRGMVERVDPYGGYLTLEGVRFYESYDEVTAAGIGVTLAKKFDYPVIVSAVPGGPADRAGFGTGDTIEGIASESLREHNLVEVQQLLSGETGTEVELRIIRRSRAAAETVSLTREVVSAPPVEARLLEQAVGYLKVPVIGPGKADETRRRMEALSAEGAVRWILDLRNSAGGTREEALALANLFVGSGTLGYLEGQTFERETFTAETNSVVSDLPLVVLVNEGTANAAEITAAAIRDNERGELVGIRTFGLGSVQKLFPLEGGRALLLSVANYYSPNGTEIQRSGVEPTVEVAAIVGDPLAAPNAGASEGDRQLDRAIEILAGEEAAIPNAA